MGRGGDLTDQERTFVLNKIMQNWNSELRQIKAGGRQKVLQHLLKLTVLTEGKGFDSKTIRELSWLMKVGFILRPMPLQFCS